MLATINCQVDFRITKVFWFIVWQKKNPSISHSSSDLSLIAATLFSKQYFFVEAYPGYLSRVLWNCSLRWYRPASCLTPSSSCCLSKACDWWKIFCFFSIFVESLLSVVHAALKHDWLLNWQLVEIKRGIVSKLNRSRINPRMVRILYNSCLVELLIHMCVLRQEFLWLLRIHWTLDLTELRELFSFWA